MTTVKQSQYIQKNRYGLLTTLSMIVGIIIGSGIFFKNNEIFYTTQSSILSLSAWLLMTFVVIFMVLCFVEISSSTKLSGKQGTFSNWGRNFVGEKMGKVVAIFFIFLYVPMGLAASSLYASTGLLESFNGYTVLGDWSFWVLSVVIGFTILMFMMFLNMFLNKPGKIIQVTGTGIKLTPIVTLIALTLIMILIVLCGGTAANPDFTTDNVANVWDVSNTLLNPIFSLGKSGLEITQLFLLAMPSVMFAYDGFLSASSLQNEAKSPKTYRTALIAGIMFVALVYLMVSWSVFTIAPTATATINGETITYLDPSIPSAFDAMFPNQNWLGPTIAFIIVLSIMTGMSGTAVHSSRDFASLSEQNIVADPHGTLLRRNKAGIPQNSALLMIGVTVLWFFTLITMDAISMHFALSISSTNTASNSDMTASGAALDFTTLTIYTMYVIVIGAGLLNRKTNKVKVEKMKGYSIFAIISMVFVALVLYNYAKYIFVPTTGDDATISTWVDYGIKLLLLGLMVGVFAFVWMYTSKTFINVKKDFLKKKDNLIKDYNQLKITNMETSWWLKFAK